MRILDALRKKGKVVLPIKDTKTVRMYYESEDINRVEVTLTTQDDETLVLEFTPNQIRKLGIDLVIAYRTIHPEFKVPRG